MVSGGVGIRRVSRRHHEVPEFGQGVGHVGGHLIRVIRVIRVIRFIRVIRVIRFIRVIRVGGHQLGELLGGNARGLL